MPDPSYGSKVHRRQGGDVLAVAKGGKIVVESGGSIDLPSGSVNDLVLSLDIADGSLDTTYYLPVPHGGKLSLIQTVTDGAVSAADITVTASIGGVAVTGGVVTIATAGSAAGDVDTASPTANNTVAAGGTIAFAVAGGGSGGSPRIHLAAVVTR